jgi:GGDEF domain-containing protein
MATQVGLTDEEILALEAQSQAQGLTDEEILALEQQQAQPSKPVTGRGSGFDGFLRDFGLLRDQPGQVPWKEQIQADVASIAPSFKQFGAQVDRFGQELDEKFIDTIGMSEAQDPNYVAARDERIKQAKEREASASEELQALQPKGELSVPQEIVSGVIRTAPDLAVGAGLSVVSPAASIAYFGARGGLPTKSELEAKGINPSWAWIDALAAGTLDQIPLMGKATGPLLQRITQKLLEEGSTELAEHVITSARASQQERPDMTMGEFLREALVTFSAGAITGAPLGVVSDNPRQSKQEAQPVAETPLEANTDVSEGLTDEQIIALEQSIQPEPAPEFGEPNQEIAPEEVPAEIDRRQGDRRVNEEEVEPEFVNELNTVTPEGEIVTAPVQLGEQRQGDRRAKTVTVEFGQPDSEIATEVAEAPQVVEPAQPKEQRANSALRSQLEQLRGVIPEEQFNAVLESVRQQDEQLAELEGLALSHPLSKLPNLNALHKAEKSGAVGRFIASSDLNGFGQVNKTFSQTVGDAVLTWYGDVWRRAAKEVGGVNAVHRSGDEFLWHGNDRAQMDAIAAKAREIIANEPMEYTAPNGEVFTYRPDFGYHVVERQEGQDLTTFVEAADSGLQQAKDVRKAETANGQKPDTYQGKPLPRGMARQSPARGNAQSGGQSDPAGTPRQQESLNRRFTDQKPPAPSEYEAAQFGPSPNTINPSGPSLTVTVSAAKIRALVDNNPNKRTWTNPVDRRSSVFGTEGRRSNATSEIAGIAYEDPTKAPAGIKVTFRADGVAGGSMGDGTAEIEFLAENAIERIEWPKSTPPGEGMRKLLRERGFKMQPAKPWVWNAPKAEKKPDTGLRQRADDTQGEPTGIDQQGRKTFTEKPEEIADRSVFAKKKAQIEKDKEKLRAILKKKDSGLQSTFIPGLSQEKVNALFDLAYLHVQSGAITFAEFSDAMIKELGDVIKPHLKKLYAAIKEKHGLAEMEDVEPVQTDTPQPTNSKAFQLEEESRLDQIVRVVQDRFRPIKRVQSAIEKSKGKISDRSNTYLAEEALTSKIENDIDTFYEQKIDPLAQEMAKNGITPDELGIYLYAKHAKERNAWVKEVRDPNNDMGSGMPDEMADDILKDLEPKKAILEKLAQQVYAVNRENIDRLEREGLMPKEQAELYRSQFQFYVPLKGIGEPNQTGMRTGSGLDVRGKLFKGAKGRTSLAENPLLHSFAQYEEGLIKSRKNEVGKTFLSLVRENPSPIWSVHSAGNVPYKREINKSTGLVEMVPDTSMAFDRENYFGVKENGQQFYIQIKEPTVINALNNMGVDQLNLFTRVMGTVTRTLARLSTSLSPEFVPTNALRDIQTAVLNTLADKQIGETSAVVLAAKIAKNSVPAMRGIYQQIRGKEGGEWGKWYRELKEDGGTIGFFGLKPIESRAKELESLVKRYKPGIGGANRKLAHGIAQWIEDANKAVENGTRLAAYRAAREAGASRQEAASIAKNISVNFNRKGEIGATMNSLYMFFNAATQSQARLVKTLATSKKAWALAGAITASSFGLAVLNRAVLGEADDDEDRWDKLPQWTKDDNLVLPRFWDVQGDPLTIPLTREWAIFHVLGTHAADVAFGKEDPVDAALDFSMAVAGAFNPLGTTQSKDPEKAAVKTLAPTAVKPFAELAVNEKFSGTPIYKEQKFTKKPDSADSFKNTTAASKAVATWLNSLTGGNEHQPGAVDIHPETLDHMVGWATGGLGRFAGSVASLGTKLVNGEEIKTDEIPFVRRLTKGEPENLDVQNFYKRKDELEGIQNEHKALKGTARNEFYRKHKAQIDLANQADRIGRVKSESVRNRQIKEFNKRYNQLKD